MNKTDVSDVPEDIAAKYLPVLLVCLECVVSAVRGLLAGGLQGIEELEV